MTISDEMADVTRSRSSRPPYVPPRESTASAEPNVPVEWVNRALLGRYRVQHILGQGAMGTVFLAEHVGLKMAVALKVIHPRLATHDDAVARFRREAHLVSRINHPNVVSVVDYGLLEGRVPFLVMQLVKGVDLRQVMTSQQPLPWLAAAAIVSQLCDALAAARVHGIIHRDIKPANVVLEPIGRGREPLVKLLDFGIAKLEPDVRTTQGAASQLTPFGVIVGTPGYMAPEQYVGERVTHRSDLYALGVVMWELICGQRLFPEGSLPELLRLQMNAPERCRELRAFGVPHPLEELMMRLLAYSALERPESAREVGNQLRALMQEKEAVSWGALRASAPTALTQTMDDKPAMDAPATRSQSGGMKRRPRPHKKRGLTLTLSLLLMTVLLGLTAGFVGDKIEESDAGARAAREHEAVAVHVTGLNAGQTNEQVTPMGTPPYALEAERLQEKRTCRGKLVHLRRLIALGDARALPFIETLAERPRTGCGPRKRQDCLACMRGELASALSGLAPPAVR